MARTKKDLYALMPVIVRDGNYEILDRFDSVADAFERYKLSEGPKVISLRIFKNALKSGRFIKGANIFLEHDLLKKTTSSMSERIEEQRKVLRSAQVFTGRLQLINTETEEVIGLFSSYQAVVEYFEGKISTRPLRHIEGNPLKSNQHQISINYELRAFISEDSYLYYQDSGFALKGWDIEKFESVDLTDEFGSNTRVYISKQQITQIEPDHSEITSNEWLTYLAQRQQRLQEKRDDRVLYREIPVIARDSNYEIMGRFPTIEQAWERLGNGVSLAIFQRCFECGECIRNIHIFLEYDVSVWALCSQSQKLQAILEKLRKNPVVTKRYKVTDGYSGDTIGFFFSYADAARHLNNLNIKITAAKVSQYCTRPLEPKKHNINVEQEFRDFNQNILFYEPCIVDDPFRK